MSDDKEHHGKFINYAIKANLPGAKELTDEEKGRIDALAFRLGVQYKSAVKHYQRMLLDMPKDDPYREELTPEEIHARAALSASDKRLERIFEKPASEVSWRDLQEVVERNSDTAIMLWNAILETATNHIESGLLTGQALTPSSPWDRAQFIIVREAFFKEWKPKGGIEAALVETLAQSFFQWNHWLKVMSGTSQYESNFDEGNISPYEGSKKWQTPRLLTAEWIDRAAAMADRFNRLFLRTLRQMRDLRRYNVPVTISNPEQVNIASDGGQQVNVQKKSKPKKKQAKKPARTDAKQPLRIASRS